MVSAILLSGLTGLGARDLAAAPAQHPAAPARMAVTPIGMPRWMAPHRPGPHAGTSYNWSGYQVNSTNNGYFTHVQGSWTVPSVSSSSCSTSGQNTWSCTWIGIDGWNNNTVEQCGTTQEYSATGQPVYFAWYEFYPNPWVQLPASYPVYPGDSISADVKFQGGHFNLQLTDSNRRWSWSSGPVSFPQAKRASAEWIEEAPSFSGAIAPLANFGSVGFNGCTYNNGLSPLASGFVNLVDTSGALEDQVSSLFGNSFSVQWVNCD